MDTQYEIRVYKLYWDNCDDLYIGSTKNSIPHRVAKHRSDARKGSTIRLHTKMREMLIENLKYTLIASCMVSNKDEQRAFEQLHIDQLRPNLNSRRAHSTPEQRIEFQRECSRQQYLANRENISDYYHQYYAANRESLNDYQREYRLANPDYKRQYDLANRERLSTHAAERVLCIYCDKHGARNGIARHAKSKTHIKKMSEYYMNLIYS